MATIWSPQDRDAVLSRFARLAPDAKPKWGKLDAPGMLAHITDAVRSSMGELQLGPPKGPLQYWPINELIMFHLPWPKGVPAPDALFARKPTDWNGELHTLRTTIDRFVARDINGPWPTHFAFGRLNGAQWGRLMHRHMDHHLGQFGA